MTKGFCAVRCIEGGIMLMITFEESNGKLIKRFAW